MFRKLRKLIFWLHLSAGLTAGLFIFLMGATGVLLMYERQILAWQDGYELPAPGAQPALPMEELAAKAGAAQKGQVPTGITREAGPGQPVAFAFGKEKQLFINPYTGEILGEGSPRLRNFFSFVTGLHRWLALPADQRDMGKTITGTAALFFFFLALSGVVIWWPRRWTWHHVKRIVTFQSRLHGPARDWNWHNVIGFWCCVPLLIVIPTGVVMAFDWANQLVFRLAGSPPPPAKSAMASPGGAAPAASLEGLNRAWSLAEAKVQGWQSISARLPAKAGDPVAFTLSQSHRGRPDLKSQLTIDLATGQERAYETFESNSRGRKWRLWIRWIHTGEAGGFWGQTVAGLTALGAVFLVWTGFALAWRRFRR